MTVRRVDLRLAMTLLVLWPGFVLAAPSPAQKCAAAKNKAATRNAVARGKCFQKAFLSGAAVDPECLAAAEQKFSAAIAKIEAKGGCSRTGDTVVLQDAVNSCISDLVSLTEDCSACTPTPTPSPSPTPVANFCELPGSVRFTDSGTVVVGGGNAGDLVFLSLPTGFCAHAFASVGNARQLRFAPGGEAFVASPTAPTTGNGVGGQAAILVVPDDNSDGVGDSPSVFLGSLPSTQGLLFANGYLYYQDGTRIMRVAYTSGDRTPSAASTQVADISVYTSGLNWPKSIDMADDGSIYVTNSGDQGESCSEPHAFHGGILELDGSAAGSPIAQGLRLPGGLRCMAGFNQCFVTEMARDYSGVAGGRSKVVPVRQGDDWGHPCCATRNLPFPDIAPTPDCSTVAAEDVSLKVTDRPTDLDFSPASWPSAWSNQAFVALQGDEGLWTGARVVALGIDGMSGGLIPGSDLSGSNDGSLRDFATGWDDGTLSHGRPYTLAFSPDGRLFVGNPMTGDIIWIAPFDLARP